MYIVKTMYISLDIVQSVSTTVVYFAIVLEDHNISYDE